MRPPLAIAICIGGMAVLDIPCAPCWVLGKVPSISRNIRRSHVRMATSAGTLASGAPIFDLGLDEKELGTTPRPPLIAVLRGVQARDLEAVGMDLLESGISLVSIPVQAPAGLESIGRLRQVFGNKIMLGAATVTAPEQVDEAAAAGASFISCPHTDPEIITRAIWHGLVVMPGVMTLTDAFMAIKHGARVLKLFPSSALSPDTVKSMRGVLPKDIPLLVSGGVTPETMAGYIRVGASGFALGSTLYTAGMDTSVLRQKARSFADGWRNGQWLGEGSVKIGEEGPNWTVTMSDGAVLQ